MKAGKVTGINIIVAWIFLVSYLVGWYYPNKIQALNDRLLMTEMQVSNLTVETSDYGDTIQELRVLCQMISGYIDTAHRVLNDPKNIR